MLEYFIRNIILDQIKRYLYTFFQSHIIFCYKKSQKTDVKANYKPLSSKNE